MGSVSPRPRRVRSFSSPSSWASSPAYRHGGEPKLAFGLLGAAVTLWATFAPCFLWIFTGAPYVERLSTNPRLAGALAGVTAAVVGVILNLSLWFALHVLFGTVTAAWHGPLLLWTPDLASLNVEALLLALLAGGAAVRTAPRHFEYAGDHSRSFARLVLAPGSSARLGSPTDQPLARNPEIDEGRPHPRAATAAIDPGERSPAPRCRRRRRRPRSTAPAHAFRSGNASGDCSNRLAARARLRPPARSPGRAPRRWRAGMPTRSAKPAAARPRYRNRYVIKLSLILSPRPTDMIGDQFAASVATTCR